MSDPFGGTKSGSVDMTPDAFKGLQGPFADMLKGLFSGGGSNPLGGIPSFQGPKSAGIGANEQKLLGDLMNNGSEGRQGYLNSVISGNFLPGEQGQNPFLDSAIRSAQRPTLEGLTETLGRVLPGRFTAGGHFTQPQGSSAFDRAAGSATTGAANALADIGTNMSYKGYDDERNRQQQAVQLGQAEVQSMTENLKAQGLPRLIEEMGIERGMQEFNMRLNALMSALGLAGAAGKPNLGNQSQTDPNIVGTLFPKGLGPMPGPK